MDVRRLLAFGTAVGIEIRRKDFAVTVVRVRPSGIEVLGHIVIAGFRDRPAAEWGREYAQFLKSHGGAYLSATVLIPRNESVVRQLALPGVSGKDMQAAIAYQIDTLHPYGDEEVLWGWSRAGTNAVIVGIARRAALDRYIELFAEAGVTVRSFTFSAAAIHAALRLYGAPAADLVAAIPAESGAVEIYGESAARPVFSAQFDVGLERAAALASAELRLDAGHPVTPLSDVLPRASVNPVENDLSRNALPYAAALAGACPRLVPAANLLPSEMRISNSRRMWVVPAMLSVLLVALAGALLGYSAYADHEYLNKLQAEIVRLEPQAKKADLLDSRTRSARARADVLDEFRMYSKADLDALNELTRLLEPPVWASAIEISRDAVVVSGEAEQAAPLLKIIDASPYFQNSAFTNITRVAAGEAFRLRAEREPGK